MYLYQQQIEEKKPVSSSAIVEALKEGEWDVLYFAKEAQIDKLIEQGRIDEDFSSRKQDFDEEMRAMMSEFA
jgi:hypothetical protein